MNTKKACWLIHENIFFEGGDTLSETLDKIKSYNKAREDNLLKVYFEYSLGDDN